MTDKPSISCIVPVYNEETRISKILEAVINHPLVKEVIVINDGSTDNTDEVLRKINGIQLISYPKNRGKSYAVMMGIKEAKNDFILMIDADLIDLTQTDITALVEPVINNEADVTISLRKNSLLIFKLFGLDYISGERVFNKNIIGNLNQIGQLFGFGLESFLNKIIIQKKLRIRVVYLKNVSHFRKGIKKEFSMALRIISYLNPLETIKIFIEMLKLKV